MLDQFTNFIKESTALFRANIKVLLSITAISAGIGLLYQMVLTGVQQMQSAGFKLMFLFLFLALILPYIYYSTRLFITTLLIINERFFQRETTIRAAFHDSKKYFWGCFGTSLLFGLLIVVPAMFFIISDVLHWDFKGKMIFTSIGVLGISLLVLNYGMAIIFSVLGHEGGSYFEKSRQLFLKHKSIMALTYITVAVLYGVNAWLPQLLFEEQLLFGLLNSHLLFSEITSLIISPFALTLLVGLFVKLRGQSTPLISEDLA